MKNAEDFVGSRVRSAFFVPVIETIEYCREDPGRKHQYEDRRESGDAAVARTLAIEEEQLRYEERDAEADDVGREQHAPNEPAALDVLAGQPCGHWCNRWPPIDDLVEICGRAGYALPRGRRSSRYRRGVRPPSRNQSHPPPRGVLDSQRRAMIDDVLMGRRPGCFWSEVP